MSFINLATLPEGKRYEDSYGLWLSIFKEVAESTEPIHVRGAPACWVPLLYYLGAAVESWRQGFQCDNVPLGNTVTGECSMLGHTGYVLGSCKEAEALGRLREYVEMSSALRPELVDALYKSDMEWSTVGRRHQTQKKFVVASNGSFFRPEVLDYLRLLDRYRPEYSRKRRNCVIVPCAADKPYPAPLHLAVIGVLVDMGLRDDYEIIIASGVLGLLPEPLWALAPEYDAGMPNPWRLMTIAADYFRHVHYERIVVYSDYNHEPLYRALSYEEQGNNYHDPRYPLACWDERGDCRDGGYKDLMSRENLDLLRGCL